MKKVISLFAMVIFMTGMVVAQSNDATTNQDGNNNVAGQVQQGQDNEALIHQGDYKGEGGNMNVQNGGEAYQEQIGDENKAIIKQRSGSWASGNFSDQYQEGLKNDATVIFYNANNESWQNQVGEENTSFIQVSGQHNYVETDQQGNRNWAKSRLLGSEESSAVTEQMGDDNKGEVFSKGMKNEAEIYQGGNMHDAYQEQNGERNKAVSTTGKWFDAEGTVTEQYQDGDRNLSRFEMQKGTGNYAKSDQDGDNNHVFYRVRGDGNSAEFTQVSNSPGNVASAKTFGDDNTIMVHQEGYGNKVGEKWGDGIYQEGDRNTAEVTQKGYDNSAEIDQIGDDNTAVYDLGPGHTNSNNNMFTGYQEGDMNEMYINHKWDDGSNYGNIINASQVGDENFIDGKFKGDDNTIDFIQSGNMNTIMGFGTDPFMFEGDYSDIDVEQVNDNNLVKANISGTNQDVDVYQESYSPGNISEIRIDAHLGGGAAAQTVDVDQIGENYSTVGIVGNGNTVTHNQYGNDGDGPLAGKNYGITSIIGDANTSSIEQEGQFNTVQHSVMGNNNMAQTEQDGYGNVGMVSQTSDGNTAIQLQDAWTSGGYEINPNNEADGNASWIMQGVGTGNVAETYQYGDMNGTAVYQWGSNNTATVDQGLWDQRHPVGIHGSGNQAVVWQMGTGHNANVMQNGSFNNATIMQTP